VILQSDLQCDCIANTGTVHFIPNQATCP
jgi:hypothetical protein